MRRKVKYGMGQLRGARRICLSALVLLVSLGCSFVGTADAAEVHVPAGFIGEPGAGNGQLSLHEHSGVAVNLSTGDIYVSDTGNHRVEQFEEDGSFVRAFAPAGTPGFTPTYLAINDAAGTDEGAVYVADSSTGTVFKFEADGTQVSSWGSAGEGKITFTGLKGIAVGPTGDLFVLSEERSVRQFNPEGTLIGGPFDAPRLASPDGLAVDPEGNLYEGNSTNNVFKFNSTGAELGEPGREEASGFVTAPTTGDLYVGEGFQATGKQVSLYGSHCGTRCTPLETFGNGELSNGQGFAVGPGNVVYVADAGTSKVAVYGVEIVEPPTVNEVELTDITATTAHVSGVIDPNAPAGEPASYKVSWEFKCFELESGSVAPERSCGGVKGELPADSSDHSVEGTLQGLEPGIKYEVRLVARNAGNTVEAGASFRTLAGPPTVREIFATGVTATEATFNARELNPRGAETSYFFEYAPEAEGFGGPNTRTSPAEILPVGTKGQEVSARVGGLQADTPYVYRLFADNSAGPLQSSTQRFRTLASLVPSGGCPNEIFRAGPGAALPDCRAYEQASPVDKQGLNVEGWPDLLSAAADGSGVTFYSQAGTSFPAGGGAHQEFLSLLATRHAETWATQRLTPSEALGESTVFLGASANLRYALVSARTETAEVSLLLIDTTTEEVIQIAHVKSGGFGVFADAAISDDGSWVFFESTGKLEGVTGARAGADNLYRWDGSSGQVSVAGLLPAGEGGKAPTHGSFGGAYDWQGAGVSEGGAMRDLYVEAIHANSDDGNQIFFTAGETGQVYLRRGFEDTPTTLRISKPDPGVTPAGQKPAAFLEATPDGSRAFLLSSEKLTSDANTGPAEEGANLYRWDAASEELVDIAPDPGDLNGPEVQGLLGASADGSSGYFVAKGQLATGGLAGEYNIYRFEEEGSGNFHLTFVADLNKGEDEKDWAASTYLSRTIEEGKAGKAARVSTDGKELVFSSVEAEDIAGYDNHACGSSGFEKCRELFMYSSAQNTVVCISCNPTGARPAGEAALSTSYLTAHLVPQVAPAATLTRNLSADGSRVFFQTPDSLVGSDTNGPPACNYLIHEAGLGRDRPTCMDVYEWEAPGAPGGSCSRAEANGGCIYLLSTGTSADPSYFVDASTSGDDVFIATTSQLVAADHDELYDMYDVRVDGGMASQQVVAAQPCTSEERCRGTAGAEPSEPTPGSSTFHGSGNPKPKPVPCRKHDGKCKKAKRSRHRRHGARKKHHRHANNRHANNHHTHKSRGGQK